MPFISYITFGIVSVGGLVLRRLCRLWRSFLLTISRPAWSLKD